MSNPKHPNATCDKSAINSKQNLAGGCTNPMGPSINLFQSKKPPVSMKIKAIGDQNSSAIPTRPASVGGFNTG